MSEPIVIYRATDGEPLTLAAPSYAADLLASGEYVKFFTGSPDEAGGAKVTEGSAPPVEGKPVKKRRG